MAARNAPDEQHAATAQSTTLQQGTASTGF